MSRATCSIVGNAFFETATVRSAGHGRYVAELDERWNLRPLPQGGIVTAIAVRAMEAELGHDEQKPRTLHTTFAAQVAHGPLEVDVELLRPGPFDVAAAGRGPQPRSRPGPSDHLCLRIPPGRLQIHRSPPTRTDPRPDRLSVFSRPAACWCPGVRTDALLGRAGRGPTGHRPRPVGRLRPGPGRAGHVVPVRRAAPMLDDGRLDPLALVVLADSMPGAVGEKVGRSERSWFAPSVDLTVHLLDDCRSSWVLAHNRARFAGDGYASADMALWDCGDDGSKSPRLVAYATQLFLFTFPS